MKGKSKLNGAALKRKRIIKPSTSSMTTNLLAPRTNLPKQSLPKARQPKEIDIQLQALLERNSGANRKKRKAPQITLAPSLLASSFNSAATASSSSSTPTSHGLRELEEDSSGFVSFKEDGRIRNERVSNIFSVLEEEKKVSKIKLQPPRLVLASR